MWQCRRQGTIKNKFNFMNITFFCFKASSLHYVFKSAHTPHKMLTLQFFFRWSTAVCSIRLIFGSRSSRQRKRKTCFRCACVCCLALSFILSFWLMRRVNIIFFLCCCGSNLWLLPFFFSLCNFTILAIAFLWAQKNIDKWIHYVVAILSLSLIAHYSVP